MLRIKNENNIDWNVLENSDDGLLSIKVGSTVLWTCKVALIEF